MEPLVDALGGVPLFQGLEATERARIAAIAEPLRLSAQSPLFREGDAGDALWVLLSGRVDVVKRDAAGHQQVLATLVGPTVLGEASLLLGDGPRSASALAMSELSLLKVPGPEFRKLLEAQDLAALKLTLVLARVLALRLVQMNERLIAVQQVGPPSNALTEFQRALGAWQF
ncbi:MAG: cyclic nucleotide-binding domain-containing protein [Myxococcaceae bacterium]